MTGYTGGNDREDYFAKPNNHPGMGAVCQYFGIGKRLGLPGYVVLPAMPGYSQGLRRAGPYGGYLGAQAAEPSFVANCFSSGEKKTGKPFSTLRTRCRQ
jgi:hypothetical protein